MTIRFNPNVTSCYRQYTAGRDDWPSFEDIPAPTVEQLRESLRNGYYYTFLTRSVNSDGEAEVAVEAGGATQPEGLVTYTPQNPGDWFRLEAEFEATPEDWLAVYADLFEANGWANAKATIVPQDGSRAAYVTLELGVSSYEGRDRRVHADRLGAWEGRTVALSRSWVTTDGEYIRGVHPTWLAEASGWAVLDPAALERRVEQYRNRLRARLAGATQEAQDAAARQRELSERRERSLVRYIDHVQSKEVDRMVNIDNIPVQPRGTSSARRWGIEIETGAGRDMPMTPAGWDYKEDCSLVSAYGSQPRWISAEECDNSYYHDVDNFYSTYMDDEGNETRVFDADDYVHPENCDECGRYYESDYYDDYDSEDCVEAVSPILTSVHSDGLRRICDAIENSPTTTSAGIHVHVEANDLSVGHIRELLLSYDAIEHLLEESYYREERGFCRRRSASELLELARRARGVRDVHSMPKGQRYVTVNLQALEAHGTIEFRAMGPKYNYDYLVKWATFCREMVSAARNGVTAKAFSKVQTWDDVMAILSEYGSELKAPVDAEVEAGELIAA